MNMNDLVSLAKRRGLIFQSSEIYGGTGSCWDYGPIGVELKLNVKDAWWKEMTYRPDIEGIDGSILMNPTVWQASGHVDNFSDPLVDCKNCKSRFRDDQIQNGKCPVCGKSDLTPPRQFNLMFKTFMGPREDTASTAYLRPETAQAIFVNFNNVQESMRKKIPFGIAQIGKAFRNEITPGNFIFRSREFEQMEMQFFIRPGTQKEYMETWQQRRFDWHLNNGIKKDNLKWFEHPASKLAHYADMAFDIEYQFPFGFSELEGIHSRTDFDLKEHQKFSGKSMLYHDPISGDKFLPYVVETSVGLDRTILALLCDAYTVETERVVLKLKPSLAPIKLAVLPLMKKEELEAVSLKIVDNLRKDFKIEYDVSGSIGKRYRRHDEIGTPYAVTIDYDSLKDNSVTIRDRDTMSQQRISIDSIVNFLRDNL